MKIYKRALQYISCIAISSIIFLVFDYLSIKTSGNSESINLYVVISGGVSVGWLAVQILFVYNKQIKKNGGLGFLTWLKLTLQCVAILLVLAIIIAWLSK